jgi:hypothetical protein
LVGRPAGPPRVVFGNGQPGDALHE